LEVNIVQCNVCVAFNTTVDGLLARNLCRTLLMVIRLEVTDESYLQKTLLTSTLSDLCMSLHDDDMYYDIQVYTDSAPPPNAADMHH